MTVSIRYEVTERDLSWARRDSAAIRATLPRGMDASWEYFWHVGPEVNVWIGDGSRELHYTGSLLYLAGHLSGWLTERPVEFVIESESVYQAAEVTIRRSDDRVRLSIETYRGTDTIEMAEGEFVEALGDFLDRLAVVIESVAPGLRLATASRRIAWRHRRPEGDRDAPLSPGRFVSLARARLDFLARDFGFHPADEGSRWMRVTVDYLGPVTGVRASWEMPDGYMAVELIVLENGQIPERPPIVSILVADIIRLRDPDRPLPDAVTPNSTFVADRILAASAQALRDLAQDALRGELTVFEEYLARLAPTRGARGLDWWATPPFDRPDRRAPAQAARSVLFAIGVVAGLGAVAAIASLAIPSAREAFGRDPVVIAIALLMPGVAAQIGIANGARRLVILSWVVPLGLVSVAAALTQRPLSWLLMALTVAAYLAMIFVPGAGERWTRVVLRR